VCHLRWITRIREKTSERLDQTKSTVGLAQQQHSAITGNITAIKTGLNFSTIEAGKTKFFLRTFCH